MARLPYVDPAEPDLRELAQRISEERGRVPHIYRMLLHSPPMAAGWLNLLTAVRQRGVLSGALRELVIMRIAILNRAPYEADQHAPIARREGVGEDKLAALAQWQDSAAFGEEERAVLALTDVMTREVQVPEDIFAAVRERFDDRTLTELTITIAAYNMVSRFLEAFEIRSEDRLTGA
jgi:AhpD family alkylhydroperoxidase